MEKISNLIDLNKFKSDNQQEALKTQLDEATVRIVNLLFRELQDIFPAFRQAWPTQEDFERAKKTWIKGFMAAGINKIEQLQFGIKKCRQSTSDFAPSCGKFIDWCNPKQEDLGLMTAQEAYEKAFVIISPYNKDMIHDDISPDQLAIIKHAIKNTGSWDMRNQAKSKTLPIFIRNYEIAIRQFNEGRLNSIPKAISDETKESIELEKQKLVAEKFERLNSYEKAMPWIKNILGMDLGDVIPK